MADRCIRGRSCEAAEPAVDDDGARYQLPAETDPDRALCPTCIRYLRYALAALPLDVAELTTLLVPSMQISYRDPDMPAPTRSKKHPPLPMDGNAEALRALIDHEVTCWAEAVADEAGVDWSSHWANRSRIGSRVQVACQLLGHRLDWLLGMPPVRYPARSTGEHPTDGHDPDLVTVDDLDYWTVRDGTDAALLLLDLHRQTERFVGRAAADRCPVPCPRCQRQSLFREHPRVVVSGTVRLGSAGQVVCRVCWAQLTDDEYGQLTDITCQLFGVTL